MELNEYIDLYVYYENVVEWIPWHLRILWQWGLMNTLTFTYTMTMGFNEYLDLYVYYDNGVNEYLDLYVYYDNGV